MAPAAICLGRLLQQAGGVQLLHVPLQEQPMAVTDLLGGQIDMMITDTATGLPQSNPASCARWA